MRPSSPIRRSSSISCIRWRGSIPLNGSSRSSTEGSWTSAEAIFTRWRMPLLYVEILRSCAYSIWTVASAFCASAPPRPWSSALATTNSLPVRKSYIPSRSGTMPIFL